MPGKSRKKAKYSVQKLKQSKPAQPKPVVQEVSANPVNQAAAISTPPPSPRIAADAPRVAPARRGAAQPARVAAFPAVSVTKELRTIGIVAAVMLAVVIVLARVLG